MPTLATIDRQEARFADAFAAGDLERVRDLYHRDVVYVSPTVRLFGWPRRIEGLERALEFIGLTIARCRDVAYRCVDRALDAAGDTAFVRIEFDWTLEGRRLRSTYVVVYRYRDERIVVQEVYYDPSAAPETV